jgi:6-phosphogluconolactonase
VAVVPDPRELALAAAEAFLASARRALAERGRFTVALSGGSTPRALYALLAAPPYREPVDWARTHIFWGDERPVPPDHPDSNYGMARALLLGPLGLPPERVHRIRAEGPDPSAAAVAYQAEIAAALGAPADASPPALDLALLGLGADGHTASLFPGSPALEERRRWMVVQFVPALRQDRFTLTPPMLNRAREVIVLVSGGDKAAALAAVLEGPEEPERWPAQLIRPGSGRLLWIVDRAAAARLRSVTPVTRGRRRR